MVLCPRVCFRELVCFRYEQIGVFLSTHLLVPITAWLLAVFWAHKCFLLLVALKFQVALLSVVVVVVVVGCLLPIEISCCVGVGGCLKKIYFHSFFLRGSKHGSSATPKKMLDDTATLNFSLTILIEWINQSTNDNDEWKHGWMDGALCPKYQYSYILSF